MRFKLNKDKVNGGTYLTRESAMTTQEQPYMSRVFDAVMQWNGTDADLTRLASLYKVDSLDILHGYDDARGRD